MRHTAVRGVLYELQRNSNAGMAHSYGITGCQDLQSVGAKKNVKGSGGLAVDTVVGGAVFN